MNRMAYTKFDFQNKLHFSGLLLLEASFNTVWSVWMVCVQMEAWPVLGWLWVAVVLNKNYFFFILAG